jgi:hypothetical protein
LNQKGAMVERLQEKASSIGRILTSLEKRYTDSHRDDPNIKKSPSGQQLGSHQPPSKKAHLKIQQIPPFNANKIRKSPSATESVELNASTPTSIKEEEPPKIEEEIVEEKN